MTKRYFVSDLRESGQSWRLGMRGAAETILVPKNSESSCHPSAPNPYHWAVGVTCKHIGGGSQTAVICKHCRKG